MKESLVTDIQRYSIHDGVGIRTTVFFKGCPLSCAWCHNPETQCSGVQLLIQRERCMGCGRCAIICPQHAVSIMAGLEVTDRSVCTHCGTCLENCVMNARELSGKYYSVRELIKEIEKDEVFYRQSGGGVTFSGGEVLAQNPIYLQELMTALFHKGYRINIDTCGYIPFDRIERILPYTDTFLYDVKLIDREKHKLWTGVYNDLILENLIRLNNYHKKIWIRIPVIGGVNNTASDILLIAEFLNTNNIIAEQVNLLAYHNIGMAKYDRLQLEYPEIKFTAPSAEELSEYQKIIRNYGYENVKIGG